MQNKPVRFGPTALSATLTTNILNPPATTGGVGCGTPNAYCIIKHIKVVNKTGSAATFSMWIGVTAGNVAGTEIFSSQTVAANAQFDAYIYMRLDATDFLVGGASAGATLTFEAEGEIGIA